MTKERELQLQIEGNASDVIQLLVKEKCMALQEAINTFMSSETFRKLELPETGLYYQSPVYIYDCLLSELSSRQKTEETQLDKAIQDVCQQIKDSKEGKIQGSPLDEFLEEL